MNAFAQTNPSGLHILLADDSTATALIVVAYLKRDGHRVTHVTDGQQAVEAFKSDPPDLVLMDVMMPVMDGIEATRRIKAMCTDHWVPLIMITGLSEKKDLIAGLRAGADDYLTKPVDPHELDARINSMLRIINIQRRLHGILDHAFDGIIGTDEAGLIQSFNLAAQHLFGFADAEIIGQNIAVLVADVDGGEAAFRPADVLDRQDSSETADGYKAIGCRKDGSRFLLRLAVTAIHQPDGIQFICLVRDVSQEEAAHQRVEFLAHHDQLTGLPNRASFSERLDATCRRGHGHTSALLFIDLDDFKPINDQYGHDIGDAALQVVARRLRGSLDGRDFVARLGGDEFVALLTDVTDSERAKAIGERLIKAISHPMELLGRTCQVGASIGVAMIDGTAVAPDLVLSAADDGMYSAKRAGKNRVAVSARDSQP
ncbi:diguanylate cyclase [Parasulfuritortus cantonensis]|uniref:Diguanylate cyclase n=1 Tax=Parasulfuritortus cantonensis TaxID=2528202 RepID=A0A4R1BAH2_9PROT|nr:diguanylate cyclase [Parasulfuritortus cantonensis]TCJ13927.1 diguanylate cyclase [Parasulfuritortus cantonensis]